MGSSNYIAFYVNGIPAPQGSKKHVGKGVMVEVSKKLKPWRKAVTAAAIQANVDKIQFTGPTKIRVIFHMPRPKCRKHDVWHIIPPDPDKLLRSTFDALTDSGIIIDDSILCAPSAEKRYETSDHGPGALIRIWSIED